jgi:flagella basal body P-ring formation protein FlgA
MKHNSENLAEKISYRLNKQILGLLLPILCIFCSVQVNCWAQTNFSGEELSRMLYEEIRMRVGKDAEIAVSKSIPNITFREKNVQVEFEFGSDAELNGNSIVGIEFYSQNNLLRRLEIPVRVRIFADVLVARETIKQGDEITLENCIVERRAIPSNVEPEEIYPDALVGKVARHSIVRGSVVTQNLLTEPFAVRRGEKVKIVVLSGKVSVIAVGTALQDASVGERVRVRRDGTQVVVTGYATKDGAVVITN